MNSSGFMGLGLTRREMTCLMFATAVHSLLFLWKGGLLTLPSAGGVPLGDPLLQVGYMSDVPEYRELGAPGEEGKKRGLVGSIRKFFGGSGSIKNQAPKGNELATGGTGDKIESTGPKWEKAGETLVSKEFSGTSNFKGIQKKTELAMTAGQDKSIPIENRSIGSAVAAAPNLKEKSFQMSKRDAPFKIASARDMDSLSNVNMVPVAMGKTTSPSVKSLDSVGSGGVVGGSALKSRELGGGKSAGFTGSGGFSGTGAAGKATGVKGGGGDSLATGGVAMGGGMIGEGGIGTGLSGTGPGGGGTTPGGMGSKQGGGGGRGGGSPYGVPGGFGGSSGAGMLPRRTLAEAPSQQVSNSSSSDMMITGELARRPIRQKIKPTYEFDARVALRFRVNSAGHVLDGIIVELSSGKPSFDNRVIEVLKQWLFVALSPEKANVIQEGVITFIFRGE